MISDASDQILVHARRLISLAIRRRWDDGLLARDPDGVFTAFLGSDHVERLMATPADSAEGDPASADSPGNSPSDSPLDSPGDSPRNSQEVSAAGGDSLHGLGVANPDTPLGKVVSRLCLTPGQTDLFAVLFACEVDPLSARLMTYLGGNQSQFHVTVDLIFETVYRARKLSPLRTSALLHEELAAVGMLRRLRLVILDNDKDGRAGRTSLGQGIRLSPRVVDALLGRIDLDADLTACARLIPPAIPVGECRPEELATAIAAWKAEGHILLVAGNAGSGREIVLRLAAMQLGRALLIVSARGLSPDQLVASFREARLQSALLVVRDIDELIDSEAGTRLRDCLLSHPETVAAIGSGRAARFCSALRPLVTVTLEVPSHADRIALWTRYLGDENGLAEEELHRIAGLYNLGVGGIVEASDSARDIARFAGGRVLREHLGTAVRQLFDEDLSAVAMRMEVSQGWDDLVLPPDLLESIANVVRRVQLRGEVFGTWGFARKLGKGLGLTVLLSGEPGTGKTMLAGLVARELGLDLYRVDLSRVTSKWLGETEKNLARAFDAAEAGHVLLLFDEADSVLGKRTADPRSSNDRYANQETNFVLARLEQFQGMAFFTTNLASAIDPALLRRMTVHVNVPFPDEDARAELWRRMIPNEAPRDEDIDYEELARRFELSGGYIRNIVLRAAYLAAQDTLPIGMIHLQTGAEMEYRERGSLNVGGRLV